MKGHKIISEQLYSAILDNIGDPVFLTDKKGIIQYANQPGKKILKHASEQLVGQNIAEFISISKNSKTLKIDFDDLQKLNDDNIDTSQDCIYITSEASQIPINLIIKHIDVKGEHILLIAVPISDEENDMLYLEIDCNDTVKHINKKGCEILGLEASQIIGQNWVEAFIPAEERQNVKDFFSSYRKSNDLQDGYYKHNIKSATGEKLLIACYYSPVLDEQNNLLSVVCKGKEIIPADKKENVFLETEARLTSMFEHSIDIVYILDLHGNLTYVNNAAEVITGYSKNEFIGASYKSFIVKQDQYRIFRTFQQVFRSGKSLRGFQFEIRTKDGERKFLETSASPIRRKDETIGFCCISRDITLRKNTERALIESEERFRTVAETAGEAIISINDKGQIIFWNRAAEQIFKYSADEVFGKSISIIMPDSAKHKHLNKFQTYIRNGKNSKSHQFRELFAVRKDGEQFPVEISQTFWKLKDLTYCTTIIRDISQRFKSEREREVLYKIVENVNTSANFNDMMDSIYQNVRRIIPAENCYIALISSDNNSLSFPLFVDKQQSTQLKAKECISLSEYLLKSCKSLLLSGNEIRELIEQNKISQLDTIPQSWLGVPLYINSEPKGVLAVQSYSENFNYTEHDQSLLVTIGSQVAFAIERKQTYEAIRTSESRFRTVIETAQDGIFLKNNELKYTHVNSALCNFFNLQADEFIGKTDAEIFGSLISERSFAKEKEVLSGNIVQLEESGVYNDELTTFHVIKYPLKDANEKIIGICGIARDITSRKKMIKAIEEEREWLRTTLKSIDDGVITTDLKGDVVLLNCAAEKMTGWTQEQAVGKKFPDIFKLIDESKANTDNYHSDLLKKANKIFSHDQYLILESRNGTKRIVKYSDAQIRDKKNEVLGSVHVFRDETEMVKFREEQQKADKLESIGILAGGIAHDFNNILTAIMSNVSLLKFETDQKTEAHEILCDVEKASIRARDLTQQLLTFSKGGSPIKKQFSISELIKDSAEFALSGSNVNCNYHIADDLSPVEADIGQTNQVINNLIINADQAMPDGGEIDVYAQNISLEKNQFPGIKGGNYVKIVIRDHGIGINKSHIPKIFDPYFSTKQKGSGLGLATCYAIIKKHEGFIGVESELGKETKFTVYLPASMHEDEIDVHHEKEILRGKGKILLMDDEEIVRSSAGKLLSHLGYEVFFACNGEEAISLYKKALDSGFPPDAVILDLTVPGAMGGKECVKQLQTIDPGVCAIVSSGYSNDTVMAEYEKYGFCDVVNKPYRINELGEILHRVLTNE
ncbi:PAS domain S-box protein [candidate division KSB1 bacterium]|nr:PAS domain S-box protein [candidate division KSB1 bacterium]